MSTSIYQTNFIVYKYTSRTSGKSYIGKTTNEKDRKYKHKYDSSHKSNTTFHRAIRKYGIDDFEYMVLCVVISVDVLDELEIELIETYDTYRNGYNMTIGGVSLTGHRVSQKTKDRRSKEVHQYTLEGEYVASYKSGTLALQITGCCHISQSIQFGSQAGGYLWSFEKKDKIEPYNKNINLPIKVYQYDLGGKYITSFDSFSLAGKSINGSCGNIYSACENNWKSYNYMWRYEQYDYIEPYKKPNRSYNVTPVKQYDLNGNFIKWFVSTLIAAKETGTCKKSIQSVCTGRRKTGGGYVWRYDK